MAALVPGHARAQAAVDGLICALASAANGDLTASVRRHLAAKSAPASSDRPGRPTMTLYTRFAAHIDAALDALAASGRLCRPGWTRANVTVEPPRDASMAISRPTPRWCWPSPPAPTRARWPRRSPPNSASSTRSRRCRVAGPGFINLRLTDDAWRDELRAIADGGADYGRSTHGRRARRSMSNMSRPTRPARCTWAIAAARWSAMRWPACSNSPATR